MEIVELLTENLPPSVTLANYVNATISLLSKDGNAKNISSNETNIGDFQYLITYNYDDGGIPIKETQLMMTKDKNLYTILYSSPISIYSDNVLKRMGESLRIH